MGNGIFDTKDIEQKLGQSLGNSRTLMSSKVSMKNHYFPDFYIDTPYDKAMIENGIKPIDELLL
jgi:hypothetical protein